jgi:MFS family permease
VSIARSAGFLHVTANLYAFGLSFQSSALLTITVPALLAALDPAHHTEALAQLSTAGSFAAMVLPPAVGAWVDGWRASRRGRRIAIATGAALNLIGLAGLYWAGTLVWLYVFSLITMAGHSVTTVAYQALWTDAVPEAERGTASGFNGAATLVGTIFGLLIAAFIPTRAALWPMFAAILTGYLSTHLMPDGSAYAGDAGGQMHAAPGHSAANSAGNNGGPSNRPGGRWRPRVRIANRRDFLLVFFAQSLVSFGMTLLMTFVLYFFRDVLHLTSPQQSTAWVAASSLAGAVVSSILLGRLSDRGRRPHLTALSCLPMALAACGFALQPDMRWIALYAVAFGLGYGGFSATGWALTLDSLADPQRITRDLGIWGIASVLPTVIAPAAGGWLLVTAPNAPVGYRWLFTLAGLCFAAAAAVILAVRGRPRPNLA